MLRIIIISFSLFFSINSFAQDWSGHVKWLYNQRNLGPTNFNDYQLFESLGDTILENRICKIIEQKYIALKDSIYESNVKIHILNYENKIISYWDTDNESFHQLYNFNLNQGDTLLTYVHSGLDDEKFYISSIIDTVKFVQVNGATKKLLFHLPIDDNNGFLIDGELIEDIGPEAYLFPYYGGGDPSPGQSLICFQNEDYFYPEGNACEIDSTLVISNITLPNDLNINIFPNPTSEKIYIEGIQPDMVHIFDITGKIVYKGTENEIDVSHFRKGFFILQIKYQEQSFTKKIIIE